jgi:hypothetical protein
MGTNVNVNDNRNYRRYVILTTLSLFLLIAVLAGSSAHGSDCPNAETAKNGFVLDGQGVSAVIRQSDEQITSMHNKYRSETPQTQFFVGGLIEVFRNSTTGQFVALPDSDFRKLFPLRKGKEQEISWLSLDARKGTAERRSMSLKATGEETIELGACAYDVVAVRQIMMDGKGEVLDTWTALYSPDLQVVLAKRYDEGTAQEETVAFKTIRPLSE